MSMRRRQAPRASRHPLRILLGALCLFPNLSNAADSDPRIEKPKPDQVEEIQVLGRPAERSLADSLRMAERSPGGVSVIDNDAIRFGPNLTFKQVLEQAPGVYIQSRYGGGETRLSIRGSGISQTFNSRGVRLMRDGLTLNEADGNLRPQLLEPLNISHMEVLRGANAMEYGVSTLGGAVAMTSLTGRNENANFARLEFGSDRYWRPQLSYGTTLGDELDVFASFSGIYTDGFRDHSEEKSSRAYANLGIQHNPGLTSRLHFDFQDNQLQLPGSLTREQVAQDPTQARSIQKRLDNSRDFEMYRGAYSFEAELNATSRLRGGLSYQGLDMFHPIFTNIVDSWQNDIALTLRYEHDPGESADPSHWNRRLLLGTNIAWGNNSSQRYRNEMESVGSSEPVRGEKNRERSREAVTTEYWIENRLALHRDVELVLTGMLTYATRNSSETLFPANTTTVLDEDYLGFSPRIGVVWSPWENTQLFSNLSRSYEAPTNGQFTNTASGNALDAQTATTLEAGARGSVPNMTSLEWEAAIYYAFVEDELLTVENPPNSGEFRTGNADDTRHFGIEFGLTGSVPINLLGDDTLILRFVYNYTDFEFHDDPAWGDNAIPGIPPHFGNAEILYALGDLYVGPVVEFASSWYANYQNDLQADAYAILGMKVGYDVTENVRLLFEAKNLTNDFYASNTSITDQSASAEPAVFNPGRVRSYFGGIEATW